MTWQQGIDEKNLIHVFELNLGHWIVFHDYDKNDYNHGRCNQK
jgi:hypothetical protein